jgi:glycosyltransferase involved in cell wall biosynthesis
MTFDTPDLSVVIISRNEERNIARCIESVLKATENISSPEIILVDSASTDRTIEIAKRYPIRVLQMKFSWPLSPAAGFYIGFLHTNGRFIQFQCGDSILDENWFNNALPVLEKNEHVAGVAGIITQEMHNTRLAKKYIQYHKNLPTGEVTYFAGDTLFKRDVLLTVGAFNPWLRAVEESELCYRIIDKGYKLLRLPKHMSHHLGCKEETFIGMFWKEIIYNMAQGQVLKYSLNLKGIFAWRLKEYKFKLLCLFLIIFGFISMIGVVLGNMFIAYVWFAGVSAVFFLILYETHGVRAAARLFITQTVKSPFFVLGFLGPKKDQNAYPTDVNVIK